MFDSGIRHLASIGAAAYRAATGGSTAGKPEDAGAAAGRPQDELSLSDPAQLVKTLFGVTPEDDGSISIDDIRHAYETRLNRFSGSLSRLMRASGVDPSQEATLESDAQGRIVVTSDHPDKAAIEQLFVHNPELANQFRFLSSTASLLASAEEGGAFSEAYAENPVAAVEEFARLLDDNRASVFRLHVEQGQMTPEVASR